MEPMGKQTVYRKAAPVASHRLGVVYKIAQSEPASQRANPELSTVRHAFAQG